MAKNKDAALAELADLGKSLAEVVEDQEQKQGKLREILDLVGSLDKDDAKALFKDERVQRLIEVATSELAESSDDPPGTVYGGMMGGVMVKGLTKKPWNEADLKRLIREGKAKIVKGYRPEVTRDVFWNGLHRQFVARRRMDVEDTFIGIYEQSLDAEELARQHAEWLFKKRDSVDDWSIVTTNGARARGTGTSGHYEPGGGMISGRSEEREGAAS